MSAANLASGQHSNRVLMNMQPTHDVGDAMNTAHKVTLDQYSNEETPYKMGRADSASQERPTASRDSLRRRTFYNGQTNTESRAELRAIQENSNTTGEFYDTVPRTKRMKSAATVKK